MKIGKRNNIKFLLICIGVFSFLYIHAQQYCTDREQFSSFITKINLLCDYNKNIFKYEEGKFIDYYYADSSVVTIFVGAMQKLPILSSDLGYYPQSIDTLENRIIIKGVKNNKCWREDSFNGVRILYDRVTMERQDIYDAILNSFLIEALDQRRLCPLLSD